MAKNATILVVDDEEATLQIMQEALALDGYEVHTASDGAEAWAALEKGLPNVKIVLTDLVMPRMDGVELARRVVKNRSKVFVLFTSGYADELVYDDKDFAGRTAFLPKPFTIEALRTKIRQILATL